MTVAEHIALSLANLKLHETLRSQSIRDPLTGLFNRRYMEESLEREMRRASRGRHPVGIIMLDLDHFKQFNDAFGHDAGDALLREVGAVLQRSIRGEDIACRYGGEEFTLILPEASLARRRAARRAAPRGHPRPQHPAPPPAASGRSRCRSASPSIPITVRPATPCSAPPTRRCIRLRRAAATASPSTLAAPADQARSSTGLASEATLREAIGIPLLQAQPRELEMSKLILVPLIAASAILAAQGLTLDEVLFRAGDELIAYEKAFGSIVAEETYTQQILDASGKVKRSRRLVSDFLLVHEPEDDIWIGFRDVFEVDGKPVRDRQQRLEDLFVQAPKNAIAQAQKIAQESARYNIGDVERTVNIPTIALVFVHPLNQYRFYFEKMGDERVEAVDAWVVRFTEHVRPTLIRAGSGDVFARGTVWIDPQSGRVLRYQLLLGDLNSNVRSDITVAFRFDERLKVWTPSDMQERYDNPRRRAEDRIEGRATYSNFRRFEVKVDESIQIPKKQS